MGEGAGDHGQFKGDGPEISGWEQGRKGRGDLGRTLLRGRGTREEGDDRWDPLVSGGASDAERALSGARCAGPCALAGRARAEGAGGACAECCEGGWAAGRNGSEVMGRCGRNGERGGGGPGCWAAGKEVGRGERSLGWVGLAVGLFLFLFYFLPNSISNQTQIYLNSKEFEFEFKLLYNQTK